MSPQERIILKERKDLLAYIAKRFREEVIKYEGFLRLSTPMNGMLNIIEVVSCELSLLISTESTTQTPSGNMFLQRTLSRSRSFMTERSIDMSSK